MAHALADDLNPKHIHLGSQEEKLAKVFKHLAKADELALYL